jgi:hypothetical protein
MKKLYALPFLSVFIYLAVILYLTFHGAPYDFAAMPPCPSRNLRAGDIILVRCPLNKPSYMAISYFTHIAVCFETENGTVLCTEANEIYTTALGATESTYFPTSTPSMFAARYAGGVAVRQLVKPLNDTQKAALRARVAEISSDVTAQYTPHRIRAYIAALAWPGLFTKERHLRYCTEYTADLLEAAGVCKMSNPYMKTPTHFASKSCRNPWETFNRPESGIFKLEHRLEVC